jgi:hypothetical protein
MWKYRSKIIIAKIRVAQLWYTLGIDEMSVDAITTHVVAKPKPAPF